MGFNFEIKVGDTVLIKTEHKEVFSLGDERLQKQMSENIWGLRAVCEAVLCDKPFTVVATFIDSKWETIILLETNDPHGVIWVNANCVDRKI